MWPVLFWGALWRNDLMAGIARGAEAEGEVLGMTGGR